MAEAGQKRVQWGDVPGWLQVLLGFIGLLTFLGGATASKIVLPSPPTKTVTITTPATTVTVQAPAESQHPHPAAAVYLSDLQPTGGDIPTRGDTQIDNQDFQHSIFYEGIRSTEQSNASACQNSSNPTCRATDYSIESGEYRHFSAMLGVEIEGGSHVAQWSLSVDGVVVKAGTVTVNSSPQQITVAIPSGKGLELEVSTPDSSGIAYRDAKIVWGDAQLS
ncbi:MAG TPA: NPCBM/NEW2 domain-containing protein [Solirubrobacteraceae bacterium]|nr:NPCBM/NEW2 domain-containing protein [Solirubrobacteraceae bacterium]